MSSGQIFLSIVIMGVSGSGKTTVGQLLAKEMGYKFQDSDDLHSRENKERMAAGIALTDQDRLPWLESIGKLLAQAERSNESIVVACSALKRTYRDTFRSFSPNVLFIHLLGSKQVIEKRMDFRQHEFMSNTLLDSQFAALEELMPDERGVSINISKGPREIVEELKHWLATTTE